MYIVYAPNLFIEYTRDLFNLYLNRDFLKYVHLKYKYTHTTIHKYTYIYIDTRI